MPEFLSDMHHIEFEKLDLNNDTEGFEKMFCDWEDAMLAHRDMTDGVFNWNNFDKWCEGKKISIPIKCRLN